MNIFDRAVIAVAHAAAAARRFGYLYALGGPVGLFHHLRNDSIRRQLARVTQYIHCEHETHRNNIAALNHEFQELISKQQSATQAAAQFWRWSRKNAGVK